MASSEVKSPPEMELLFLDSFIHEDDEFELTQDKVTKDKILFPVPVVVKEIRVIPFGTTISMSYGLYIGQSFPSEIELEFEYEEHLKENPNKKTLETFKYNSSNDKLQVETEEIVTRSLFVSGCYSSLSLAVFGYPVDKMKPNSCPKEED